MTKIVSGMGGVIIVLLLVLILNKEDSKDIQIVPKVTTVLETDNNRMTSELEKYKHEMLSYKNEMLSYKNDMEKFKSKMSKEKLEYSKKLKEKENINAKLLEQTRKETVVKGYQKSYEYISKNNLVSLETGVKVLSDGTPYKIFTDSPTELTVEEINDSDTPPDAPITTSATVNGEKVYLVVVAGTTQVATLSTTESGNQVLVVNTLTNETETNTESDAVMSSPPSPSSSIASGVSADSSDALPTAPDEIVSTNTPLS